MAVKRFGLFVLGIDDESEDRDFGAQRPLQGIANKARTYAAPAIGSIDGKSSHQCDRNRRIVRKALGKIGRYIGQSYAAGCQRVVSRDFRHGIIDRDIAGRYGTAYILTYLRVKIAVERVNAARKGFAIMSAA